MENEVFFSRYHTLVDLCGMDPEEALAILNKETWIGYGITTTIVTGAINPTSMSVEANDACVKLSWPQ